MYLSPQNSCKCFLLRQEASYFVDHCSTTTLTVHTRSRELERQRKQLLVWGRVWYVRKVRGGGLRLLWSITLLSFDLHNATQHTYNDNNDNTPASISSPRGGNGDRPSLGRFPQFFIYTFFRLSWETSTFKHYHPGGSPGVLAKTDYATTLCLFWVLESSRKIKK